MLFQSIEYIFLFLPLCTAVAFGLQALGRGSAANLALLAASLFFYAYWNVPDLALLAGSILVNFVVGGMIARWRAVASLARVLLIGGVVFNLGLLAWFKYAGFLAQSAAAFGLARFAEFDVALPLAISFFTFQQIAWLVERFRNPSSDDPTLLEYALFVAFFPQLIAGPIVRLNEMIPQFRARAENGRALLAGFSRNVAVGATIFAIGLAKKVLIADSCAALANPAFAAAELGQVIDAGSAWVATLAFTFQIYFDFSAYTDMALGSALMFAIRLPINFNSPYQARSIIDFWRRWHITLSRFLRDYLYIPLGGGRRGWTRQAAAIAVTMLLGGLWHGAAWTFVAWGGLHGAFLIVNHLARRRADGRIAAAFAGWPGWALTMVCVVNAWVLFRAETFSGAWTMYGALYSGPIELASGALAYIHTGLLWLLLTGAGIAVLAPNTAWLFQRHRPFLSTDGDRAPEDPPIVRLLQAWNWRRSRLMWRPSAGWGAAAAVLLLVGLVTIARRPDYVEFIYFRF